MEKEKKNKSCDRLAVKDVNTSEQSNKKSNGLILNHCKYH